MDSTNTDRLFIKIKGLAGILAARNYLAGLVREDQGEGAFRKECTTFSDWLEKIRNRPVDRTLLWVECRVDLS
ncbi:MAG TPA: hypothetical protein PLF39_08675 [Synergistales bacterium]|nr:hypothetical protein [Synergistales bacterium]